MASGIVRLPGAAATPKSELVVGSGSGIRLQSEPDAESESLVVPDPPVELRVPTVESENAKATRSTRRALGGQLVDTPNGKERKRIARLVRELRSTSKAAAREAAALKENEDWRPNGSVDRLQKGLKQLLDAGYTALAKSMSDRWLAEIARFDTTAPRVVAPSSVNFESQRNNR